METTGINKTVYRSNVISALDSFTSVRNVLAWEMFQDGQVRNYNGVLNDLQRLYPDIDFDSVTENVDPESIAADEDAIYTLVDNIINKLIESGISKDNFNYAIWACDDPENVADTYGVESEDVSAYKITDGILLQDLGYEGQLYGVAEYPEEEWDVIENKLIVQMQQPRHYEDNQWEMEHRNDPEEEPDPRMPDYDKFVEISVQRVLQGVPQETIVVGSPSLEEMKSCLQQTRLTFTGAITNLQIGDIVEYRTRDWKASGKIVSSQYFTRSTTQDYYDAFAEPSKRYSVMGLVKDKWLTEKIRRVKSSFQGGNMKTREDYKDYYLEQLSENYGDMTERDYNSAKKFCYDEEWNLGEVGNMAEAIDGLGDAWTEYQKQYKEGFEIMNNWNIKPIDSSLEPEWTVYEPHFKNLKARHEDDPKNGWGAMEGQQKKIIEDNDHKVVVEYGHSGSCTLYGAETGEVISPFSTIKDMQDFKKKNNLTIVKNSKGNNMIKSSYNDNYDIEDLKLVFEQAEEYAGNILLAARDWIPSKEYNQFQKKEFKSGDWTVVVDPDGTFSWNGAGLGIYYYYKTQYCPIFEKEYKLNQHYDYESQSWNNLLVQTPRRANGLRDLTAGNSAKTNTMGIDWEDVLRTLKTIVSSKRKNNMIKSSNETLEEQNGELPEYFEKDGTPKYEKIYDDFWDIGSNGVMEYIGSSRRNNMKKNIKSSVEDVYYNRDFSQYDDAREYAEKLANKLGDITIIKDTFGFKVDYYIDGKFNHTSDIFSEKENYDNLITIEYHNDLFSVSYKGSKIKSSKENNMIKSGIAAFDRAIEKKYNGTSPNGAGQYYLDWKYNLADEKDNIERLADENGLSVEFQSDEGYFEVYSSRKPIKSSVRDHYLLGKQNFLTEHVFGIDDDGDVEYEYDFGEELVDAEMSIFEKSETGFVGFDIESHRAGKIKTRHEVLDYDGLENKIEGSDIKNGVAIYEDSNGIITVAAMGSNWHNTKTGEEGTDYTLFKAVDYNAEPEDEEIESSRKPIKSSKWVEDVADKQGITFEQVLEVFKDNGYGEDEADDFWNSKWSDVSDAFGEDGIAGLDELFGIEIETEDDDIYEDNKDVDYDKYHLNRGEVKIEDFQKELMNAGYSKEDIDYVFGNNKLFNMQYLDKYWQDRVRRGLEFRKGKSVTSARKSIKSSSMIYKENEMPSVMKDRIYWEIYYYNEGDNKELGTQNRYDSVRGMSFTQAKRRAKQLMKDYNCDTACMQTTGGNGVIIKNDSIGDKNMKIQSKRLIKSGTSNFGSNDNVYGYSFPLVAFIAESYVYDEENDTETDERDYDLDDMLYEEAIEDAKNLAAEMDVPLWKDYRDPDYAPAFCVSFESGYYEGIWVKIEEGGDTMVYNEETGDYDDMPEAEFDKLADKINAYLKKLVTDYGWDAFGVSARFSNGETWYNKVDL